MARQPRTFKYTCPNCGLEQTVNCKRCKEVYRFDPTFRPGEKRVKVRITFGETQWRRAIARAKVTPAVNGPAELVRLALDEILAMPPVRLISA